MSRRFTSFCRLMLTSTAAMQINAYLSCWLPDMNFISRCKHTTTTTSVEMNATLRLQISVGLVDALQGTLNLFPNKNIVNFQTLFLRVNKSVFS